MKRYWKLIAIAAVIVLVIGTFYIQSSLAASKYPNFIFEKKSGDEAEVKGLTVGGRYKGEGAEDYVDISEDEMIYQSKISFFERINGLYLSPKVIKLQEEYRNFMRGKHRNNYSSFFEDETLVAYANVDWDYYNYRPTKFTFDIEILDKDSKKNTAFNIAVPDQGNYNNMYVEGVVVSKGELFIATTNYLDETNGTDFKEMHLYRWDIKSKQLIDDAVIHFTADKIESSWSSTFMLESDDYQAPLNYLLFAKQGGVYVNGNEDGAQAPSMELIAYNLETNEQAPVHIPKNVGQDAFPNAFSGSTVYFSEIVDNHLEISKYDLESKKVETRQFEPEKGLDSLHFIIKNDKLYLMNALEAKKEKATISVIDISTGDSVYEGAIVRDKQDNAKEIYSLTLDGLNIK